MHCENNTCVKQNKIIQSCIDFNSKNVGLQRGAYLEYSKELRNFWQCGRARNSVKLMLQ